MAKGKLHMDEIKFTDERLEVLFKGKKFQAFGTTDPNLVFIPTIGKFVNKNESVNEQKDSKDNFLDENGLNATAWTHMLIDIPSGNSGEFYLNFDSLGTKHYISADKKDKLIEWMKLTDELFL